MAIYSFYVPLNSLFHSPITPPLLKNILIINKYDIFLYSRKLHVVHVISVEDNYAIAKIFLEFPFDRKSWQWLLRYTKSKSFTFHKCLLLVDFLEQYFKYNYAKFLSIFGIITNSLFAI